MISNAIGAALEWFDTIVFATFATVIAKNFYPDSDPALASILAFATFGISYLIRPIGGMVLGRYVDRKGRRSPCLNKYARQIRHPPTGHASWLG